MTEFMGLAEKVSKFNQEALKHIERQTLNPFSGRFSRSPSPRPKFNKDEYGKPAAGSKTEMRGQRAFTQISREILELCEVIHDMGARKRDSDGDECIIIPFGELFAFYTKISDKVVGLLIAAKKRGFVWFEPEILFQRRDDDVLIALLKPIEEIRNIINRQISASPSPAPPVAETDKLSRSPTPSPLARQESNTSTEASSALSEPTKPVPSPASAAESTSTSAAEPASASTNEPASASNIEHAPASTADSTPVSNAEPNSASTADSAPASTAKLVPAVAAEPTPAIAGPAEPTPSSAENVSEQTTPVIVTEAIETNQQPSTPVSTVSVEEENNSSSNETVVLTEQSLSAEAPTVEEQSLTVIIVEPPVENDNSPTNEQELPSEGEQTNPVTSAVESEPVSQPQELTIPTEEDKTVTESPENSEEHDSLSLKILVPVNQAPVASELSELPSASVEVEQTPVSTEPPVSATEETFSSSPQVAPDDNEQTKTSETTVETDQTLPSSDKSEKIVPSPEKEQTPPSNDTGEKTLA